MNLIWQIISLLIVVSGLILLIWKTKKQQKETGFAYTFITAGLAMVTEAFGTFSDKFFAAITGDTVSNNVLQIIVGFALIAIGFWMNSYIRNKLSILNLLGVKERRIEEHREDVGLNQFEFKEREIDLGHYATMEMNADRYKEATDLIKLKVESFYSENKEVKKGYTGTAPIPLTLYAGYCYKGGPTTEFFEYDRSSHKYNKLKKGDNPETAYEKLKLLHPLDSYNLEEETEVVLGISVTMKIREEQVEQFKAPFIHLSIDNPKQNAIEFEEQLKEYVEKTSSILIDLGNVYNIKKIHLVISSQSCFVFEIGKQLITETYMPEVINYHFVNNGTPPYQWGISFNHQGTKYIDCVKQGAELTNV